MMLSRTELLLLSAVGKGTIHIPEIANALHKSASQIYRTVSSLQKKEILHLSQSQLHPERKTHINALLTILSKTNNVSEPLSGTGIQIYSQLLKPKTVTELETETGLHKTTILKKLRQGRKMSLLLREEKKYRVNEKLWEDVKNFLEELTVFEESLDERIPVGSVIYHKNDDEIVFSTKEPLDAEKTAFSAYDQYGIGLLLIKTYYVLPKKKLSIQNIFLHSLFVAEKEPESRYLTMIALFFIAHKKQLLGIRHSILSNILNVLSGTKISGYPTREEIKDRASIYHVEV